MRRGSLGAVGSSEGDRGGVNGLCVGGGAVEIKKKERRGRERTGKKQKGEGRIGHSAGSMNYEPLYQLRTYGQIHLWINTAGSVQQNNKIMPLHAVTMQL